MNFRKCLFWSHLIAGSVGGVIILLMSLTGVILTYERQILASVERGSFQTQPTGQRLSVEELLSKASEQRDFPNNATLTLRSDPREPAEIGGQREGTFFVNAYTGQVLGAPQSSGWRSFFQSVTSWHRWIGMEGEGRGVAKAITGACNLAFLGIVVSGAYLWLPKKLSKQHLRPITWFRGGLSGKARDFNWHNTFGIWSLVPLFFIVLSGVPMSYTWANDLIYSMTGSAPPTNNAKGGEKGGEKGKGKEKQRPREEQAASTEHPKADYSGLNVLWSKAEAQIPGWTSITLRIPDGSNRPASFDIDTGDGGQPQKRATLTLDRSGNLVRFETFADGNLGRRLRTYARFLHTGEVLGIPGQTVAGIASAGGVMLVWTGISLALRRYAAWRERKKKLVPEMAATQA